MVTLFCICDVKEFSCEGEHCLRDAALFIVVNAWMTYL